MVSRTATQPHRFQRYYSTLRIGRSLTAKCQRTDPVLAHYRQSEMDGACAHHALASALTIMGFIKRSAAIEQSRRRYGLAADLYTVLADHWMEGIFAAELVGAIEQLRLPLDLKWADGFDSGVDTLAVEALMRGALVLCAYESERNRHRHWVTAVGCGGLADRKTATVDSLLVLDSSMDPLPFSLCNGQLTTSKVIDFRRRKTSVRWIYESVEGAEPVRLMSAISLTVRPSPLSKRRH